jgi:hypothetical protein
LRPIFRFEPLTKLLLIFLIKPVTILQLLLLGLELSLLFDAYDATTTAVGDILDLETAVIAEVKVEYFNIDSKPDETFTV